MSMRGGKGLEKTPAGNSRNVSPSYPVLYTVNCNTMYNTKSLVNVFQDRIILNEGQHLLIE